MSEPEPQQPDDIYAKWVESFETISNETMTLWLYRDYWRGLAEITSANPDIPPSGIFDALGVWYASAQTVGVRRQLDRDPRSVSLWNLLTALADHPDVMSRERHVGLWGGDELFRRRGHENFDRFAGEGADVIAPERTLADRAKLEEIASPITRFVNKAVAHTDEQRLSEVPTYEELNRALDEFGQLLKKYSSLLKAEMLAVVAPVHQYDWKAPFRVPWIRPDEST